MYLHNFAQCSGQNGCTQRKSFYTSEINYKSGISFFNRNVKTSVGLKFEPATLSKLFDCLKVGISLTLLYTNGYGLHLNFENLCKIILSLGDV